LFERQLNPDFKDITTSMWYTHITFSTVGYGDFFAKSHLGKVIAVMMAFWGTLNSSLFIVSLNNILAHDPSE
jgi:hypothetical protein